MSGLRSKSAICYNPGILYKPEGMYAPPAGYRAESFLVPFSFNVLANGECSPTSRGSSMMTCRGSFAECCGRNAELLRL